MNIEQTLQLLGIQDVTTKQQKKNGTREFKLPVKDQYGSEIHVASFASGYVRRTKAGGHCPSWQVNKRIETDPEYFKDYEWKDGDQVWTGKYRKFTCKGSKLIPDEQDRLAYLISYCLKNYYIGQANMLSSGNFIPKWKHEDKIKNAIENEKLKNKIGWRYGNDDEISVTINGHRYNIK